MTLGILTTDGSAFQPEVVAIEQGDSGVRHAMIPGCGGAYAAGDDGSIWTRIGRGRLAAFGRWQRMKFNRRKSGHLTVRLSQNTRSVHQLVLESFVGPCPDGMECRHRNDVPADNRLTNLIWGTRPQNISDRIKNGKKIGQPGSVHFLSKMTEDDVVCCRSEVASGCSIMQLAKQAGVSHGTMYNAVTGVTWRHLPGAIPAKGEAVVSDELIAACQTFRREGKTIAEIMSLTRVSQRAVLKALR